MNKNERLILLHNAMSECSMPEIIQAAFTQAGVRGDDKMMDLLGNIISNASQPVVETDALDLCKNCEDIGRNDKHSYFCRKCGAPLN